MMASSAANTKDMYVGRVDGFMFCNKIIYETDVDNDMMSMSLGE